MIAHACLVSLTLSDPMSDLVRHYDFPVPDTLLMQYGLSQQIAQVALFLFLFFSFKTVG
jgi:hypothetical protein